MTGRHSTALSVTMTFMATLRSTAEHSQMYADDRNPARIKVEFVAAPSPNLEAHVRQAFDNLGEEYDELCERLFVDDPDLSLA